MRNKTKPPVVAGVDGTEQGILAVQYAVGEAQRAGCALRLVHVLPELAATSPIVPFAGFEMFDELAMRLMQQAEQAAREASGNGLRLEKVIRPGTRVHTLVTASEDARLVVLGCRDRSLRERFLTGSTTVGVAARAHCPVVCVPSDWSGSDTHRTVVVGVEDPEHAHELLLQAFAGASERRARLRVLHAWRLQRPYDDLAVGSASAADWSGALSERLSLAMEGLRSAFPEVSVTLDVHHQDPTAALLEAAHDADLLLVGRRGHRAPAGFALGSTARALIQAAPCPVEITPLHPAQLDLTSPDLALVPDELSPQT